MMEETREEKGREGKKIDMSKVSPMMTSFSFYINSDTTLIMQKLVEGFHTLNTS
jgi:hypothetical protein